MSETTPEDTAAAKARALESWEREQAETRMRLLLDKRPAEFAEPGTLDPRIAEWADAYLTAGRSRALIIVGPVGAGKTWSLWKTAEHLVSRGWRGRAEIASSYELKEATDRPVDKPQIATWRDADLFCVDDIGSQRLNDWDLDALFTIVDPRRQHQRPTVITSNNADLRDLIGERVASRIAGGATKVVFAGEDRRRGQQ